MATRTGKVFVDVYAQTAPAEKALQRIQKIANTPINLNLKGGTYTGPLGRITGQVGEFDKSLEAANARVIAFGASAGVIYNTARAFEYLVKTTIEVEKRLNDIKVILNTTTKDFSNFSNELFNIASRTGQTFAVATDAALELARQGLGLETTLKRTSAALSLTRISGLEVTKSVEAITAAINSFNKSAIDEINLVSKLSNVDTQFAVSSQDLAEALTRVGSTAQDAGTSIDELIGLVTAVQQTTSRGGPVIGNAFKTIFTRLSNSNTIEQLKALGVQIDETQNGLDKLRAISDAIKNVDETQANTIKRLAAGVYQINILSAVLSDLSNKYSIVSQAQNVAAQSTNESEIRIRNLNKTLSGLINETINNFTRLTSQIGETAVLPNLDNFLKGINSTILTFTKEDGEGAGFSFADAFFKGFGQFLSGPAFGLGSVLLLSLITKLGKFAVDSVTKLLQQSKELARNAQLANYVNEALATQPNIIEGIRSRTISVAQAQELIISRLKEINNLRTIELGLINQTATTLNARGFQVGKQPIGNKEYPTLVQQVRPSKTKAAGFIPNYTREVITEKIGAYAGGYKPGTVKTTSIPKIGRVVYNSAEQIKKFKGLDQPAIIPPKNSEAGKKYQVDFITKLGFDPYKNKADGFVPNFAKNLFKNIHPILKQPIDEQFANLIDTADFASKFVQFNNNQQPKFSFSSKLPNQVLGEYRFAQDPDILLGRKKFVELLQGNISREQLQRKLGLVLGHELGHKKDFDYLRKNISLFSSRDDFRSAILKDKEKFGKYPNELAFVSRLADPYRESLAEIAGRSIIDRPFSIKKGDQIELLPFEAFDSYKILKNSGFLSFNKGLIPNFVRPRGKLLGEGAYGQFIDLQKSFKGLKIGKKVFHDAEPNALLETVSNEFAGHQKLSSLNLPPFLSLPKLIGNRSRSVKRGYIGKEVIPGMTFEDIENKYLDYNDKIKDLTAKQKMGIYDFSKASMDQSYYALLKEGVNVRDFRNGGNVMFNNEFINKVEQIARRNPNLIHKFRDDPKRLLQVLNSLGKKGAKMYAVDTDISQFKKTYNKGLVPNFAKLYTRRPNINPLKINPKLSSDIGDDFDYITPNPKRKIFNKKQKIPNLIDKNGVAQFLQFSGNPYESISNVFDRLTTESYYSRPYSSHFEESQRLAQSRKHAIQFARKTLEKYFPSFSKYIDNDLLANISPKQSSSNLDILKQVTSPVAQLGTKQEYLDALNKNFDPTIVPTSESKSYRELYKSLKYQSRIPFSSLNQKQISEIFPSLDKRFLKLPYTNIGEIILGKNPYKTVNELTFGGDVLTSNKQLLDMLDTPSDTLDRHTVIKKLYSNLDDNFIDKKLNIYGLNTIGKKHQILSFINNNIKSEQFNKIRTAYGAAGQARQYTYADLVGHLTNEDLTNGAKSSVTKTFERLQERLSIEKKKELEENIKEGKIKTFPKNKFLNKDTKDVKILRNEAQLFDEGEVLGHCVGSYGNACFYEDPSTGVPRSLIVSTGSTTAELDPNIQNGIVRAYQIRGKNNSTASQEEYEKIRNFVKENGLIPNFVNPKNRYTLGFIPNFNAILGYGSGSLGAAIQREASAGIPKSKIKVGKHPALISPANKMGFGVYNTLDEPRGLIQGIQRARKEGFNPKKYGASSGIVPNFAPFPKPPRSLKVGVFDPYNLNPAFAQANQATTFTQAALNKVQGPPFSQQNIEEINKRILEAAQRVQEFGQRWQKNPTFRKLETELQDFVKNITSSKDAARVVSKTFRNSVKKAFEYEQRLKEYNKTIAVEAQRREAKKEALVEEASGLFVSKKRREAAIAKLRDLGKYDPDIANRIEAIRQNHATRSTQAGLGASFLIPILTSAISEAAGNATPTARKVSATADFSGSVLSSAALGLGVSGGNPIGAIAGGIFGAGLGGSKFLNELRTQLPELEKDLEQASRKLESFNNSFTQYVQSVEKYQAALNDASGAISIQDIEKFRKNTITKLLEIPPEFRGQIAAASGSIEQLGKVMGELSEKLGRSEKIEKASLALRQIYEEATNPFTLDRTTLDTRKTKEFEKNRRDISNILTTSIDPNEITKQSATIIKAAKDVQFSGGKGIAALLLSLKDLAKVPEAVVDQFKTIGGTGSTDAVQLAKIIEEVVKSIQETDKFTKIADTARKSLTKLNSEFGREINNLQKQIAVLISSLGVASTKVARSVLTQNKISRGNEQFGIQRGITRLQGESSLQEAFLSDLAKNNLNNSIEEIKLSFDKLKTIQDLVADAQERGLEIFVDNIVKAGSTLADLSQKAADRDLTAEDTTSQQINERNIQNLTNVFKSIVEEIANNPQKAVADITRDKLTGSRLTEAQISDILARSGDTLNKLRNDILLANETSKQNLELLRLNNQYSQAQLLQQKRLTQFGGIKAFIDRSSLDEFESLIREGAGLRFGGRTTDRGIFSAKVIENLTDRLGVSGEQLPSQLFDIAKAGRIESIKQDIDLAKIAAGLTGAFDSNQLDALENLKDLAPEIADIQVRSLAKFDSLPVSALQIESQIIDLNRQINDYINSYVDKNELSLRTALNNSNISSHTDEIRSITQSILNSNNDIVALTRGREVAAKQNELKNLSQNRQIQLEGIGKDFTETIRQLEINRTKLNPAVTKNTPEEAQIEFARLQQRRRALIGNEQNVTQDDVNTLLRFINTRGVNNLSDTVTSNIRSNFIGRKDVGDLARPNIATETDLISQGKFDIQGINTDVFKGFNESITQLDSRIKVLNDEISKISEQPIRTPSEKKPTNDKIETKFGGFSINTQIIDLNKLQTRQIAISKELENHVELNKQKAALIQTELVRIRSIAESLNDIKNINKENNEQYKQAIESLNQLEKLRLEREFAAAKVRVDELKSSSASFTDEIANATKEANTLKARLGELRPGDLGTQFLDTWKYNFATFQRDLNDGVYEIGYSMKDAFKEGFKEFVKGTKDAEEALRDLALSVADKALDIATNIAFDQIFSAVGSGLNSAFSKKSTVSKGATGGSVTKSGIKGYAEGGLVTGGSGKKDDVAAMLSPGEYVLRQEAVQALTPALLDKLNEQKINPTTVKKLENGVDATFLNDLIYTKGPTNRPEEAKLIFDPNLSNFALTDEDNPQNSRRFQKEEEFISYIRERLEYDRQKKEALRKYKRGQESSFYTQLIAAAASSAAGAYNQYGGGSKNSLGRSTSDPRGLEPSTNADYNKILRNKGGIIPRYANGGYHTDTMPALLTGGEYVISRGAVRRYGTDFFERLNEMRFAEGGLVGYNTRSGINTDNNSENISDSIDRMSAAAESLSTILGALNTINNNQNTLVGNTNNPTNNVNITINIEDNGKVQATSNNTTETNADNKDRKQTVEQTKQLTQLIQAEVVKIITQQQRDGGLLANTRR